MKKLSIIIPVYNAEQYLEECLNSVIGQTMPVSEMEILAVDDCSTDRSMEILQDYAKRCDSIRILQTGRNAGAGGARNLALAQAQGEYIGFVDSDDAIQPRMYEKLYEKAKSGDYDIVDSGIYIQEKDLAILHTADEATGEQNDEKRCVNLVSGGYIVSKIFKRELLEKYPLCFRENVILEDMEYVMHYMCHAKTIGTVKEIFYIYRDTGASSSKEHDPMKYHKNVIQAMQAVYDTMHVFEGYESLREAVEYAILQLYSFDINNLLAARGTYREEEILDQLRKLRQIRTQTVTGGFDNSYVQAKISAQDIEIMKWNDQAFE